MATKTWYLNARNLGSGTQFLFFDSDLSDVPSGTNLSETAWRVGRNSSGNYAEMEQGTEISENNFSTTLPTTPSTGVRIETPTAPDDTFQNTYNTTGEIIIPQSYIAFAFPYNAVFTNGGTWTLTLDVIADRRSWQGGAGRLIAKFYKMVFNGNNNSFLATQLEDSSNGTNWINGSTVSNLTTSAAQTCTINFTPSGIPPAGGGTGFWQIFNGDRTISTASASGYMAIALVWEITTGNSGAGRNRNCDAIITYGTNTSSQLVSPSFRRKIYATQ